MNGCEALQRNSTAIDAQAGGAATGSGRSDLFAAWMSIMPGGDRAAETAACVWRLLGRRGSANLAFAIKGASTSNPSDFWEACGGYYLEMERDLRVGAAEMWRSMIGHAGEKSAGPPPAEPIRAPAANDRHWVTGSPRPRSPQGKSLAG